MAVLDATTRAAVHAELMRRISNERQSCAITKSDLRAAVDAMDDFLNTNQTAINNAFPTAARTGLTTAQKALVLMYVIDQRYLSGA